MAWNNNIDHSFLASMGYNPDMSLNGGVNIGNSVNDMAYGDVGYDFNFDKNAYNTNSNLTGMSGMDMGQLGLAGIQTLMGGIGAYKNYGLQKDALRSNLADARMQRSLAAENYINQQGVRSSLAGAFGGNNSGYKDAQDKYGKYQEKE